MPPPTLDRGRADPDGLYGIELFPADNGLAAGDRFFPLLWGQNELFMAVAQVVTPDSGADPIAVIEMNWLSRNLESGSGDYITLGNDVAGGMLHSAMPGLTPNDYVSLWYGNNAPLNSDPMKAGVGHVFKVFNLGDFMNPGAGLDPVEVLSFKVYRIDGLSLEGN